MAANSNLAPGIWAMISVCYSYLKSTNKFSKPVHLVMCKFDFNICADEASFSSYSHELLDLSDSVCDAGIKSQSTLAVCPYVLLPLQLAMPVAPCAPRMERPKAGNSGGCQVTLCTVGAGLCSPWHFVPPGGTNTMFNDMCKV